MQDLPHHYVVAASAKTDSIVNISGDGLAVIESAPPAEFGGPGDLWSPESLLVASVADCFILTFRAVARASKLEWVSLSCSVEGTLERVDKVTKFTEFKEAVVLQVAAGTDEAKARRLLDMAERSCLITNSLSAEVHLDADVKIAA